MPDPTAAAAAGIGGGIANIFAAQSASGAQQQAAQQATNSTTGLLNSGLNTQQGLFTQGNAPLSNIAMQGQQAYQNLNNAIPGLTAPIVMNQAALEKTPGYQFNLSQGERGVQLGGAALGLSGAQAKSAAQYATGLADNTYQNQFNNANTNKQNAYNFLLGAAQPGIASAGQYGVNSTVSGNAALGAYTNAANTINGNIIGSGNAQAAGDIAMGNAAGQILGGLAGSPTKTTNPFGTTNPYASPNPFGNYGTSSMYGTTGH